MFTISTAFLKQLWLTLGSSLSYLIIGLVRGYSSSAIPSIISDEPSLIQHSEQKSWIGAIPPLGAFTGSVVSGVMMESLGRRRTLQLAAPLWTLAWLLVALAPSLTLMLLGRILSGFCVGLVLAPAQVYVSECCEPAVRGRLGSFPPLAMSLGIVLSYVAGACLRWRNLAFFSAAFCLILFLVLIPLPESPVWLESKCKNSKEAMEWLQFSSRDEVKNENYAKKTEQKDGVLSLRELWLPEVRRPLVVVTGLLLFQQLSGVDAVIFFTVEIFQTSGSKLDPMAATVLVGVVQLVSNGLALGAVDRAGRRPLLLLSALTMTFAMMAMGTAFHFRLADTWLGYLPMASLVLFMVGFSAGFGGLPFLLLGEMFPARRRSQLAAAAGALNLISMFTVIKTYHSLERWITAAGTFWMYACFCACAFFFVLLLVPETKGKTLAEIERHFRGEVKGGCQSPQIP